MLHIFQKAKVLLYYQVPLSEHLQDVNFCQFLPNPHENLDWSNIYISRFFMLFLFHKKLFP